MYANFIIAYKESIYTIYRNRGLRVLCKVIIISGSPLLHSIYHRVILHLII